MSPPRHGIKGHCTCKARVLQLEGHAMPEIHVKIIEPAALSPKGTCAYLSLSKRSVSTLVADGGLMAKRTGGRTLISSRGVKAYYASLPVKTAAASIPNAPQSIGASKPRAREGKQVRS